MLGLSIPEVAGRRMAPDPAAAALIARMSAAPDMARAGLIDALVRAIKAAGVWAKLDLLYLTAAHDAQAARRNWIGDAYNLTTVSTPAFTADRGYAGDGAGSYLDTGWAPSAGVQYALNSGTIGCWINGGADVASDTAVAMGATSTTGQAALLVPRGTAGPIRGRINQAVTSDSGGATASRMGFTALSRTSASLVTAYRDGVASGGFTTASGQRPDRTLFLGGLNSGVFGNGSTSRIAAAFAGAGLSGDEAAALHAALAAYLAAIGAS